MTLPRLLIAFVVVAAAAAWFFYPESGAIIWHLKHGSTAEFSGMSFPVPLLSSVNTPPKANVLYMVAVPGRARNSFKNGRKVSMISIDQPPDRNIAPLTGENVAPWASHSYMKTFERSSSLAGHAGRCIGFSGDAIWSGETDVEIFCDFKGLYQAHFSGTQTEVADFFRVIDNAQEVKGKN